MPYDYRIIQNTDVEEIFSYEMDRLKEEIPNEDERMIHSWNTKWRKEALNHYSALGWSFLARDPEIPSPMSSEGLLVGYFIAQPLLFLDGKTQTLWIEHLQFSSLQVRDELCDLAYKLSREKHFQKVLIPNTGSIINSISSFKPEPWGNQVFSIKTTKAL